MASTVKVLFKSWVPGLGIDSSGNPKQGKTQVIARMDVTNYAATAGEPLTPRMLGLSSIDFARVEVSAPGGAPAQSETTTLQAVYDPVAGVVWFSEVVAAAGPVAAGATDDPVFQIHAFGDSAVITEDT